MDNRLREIRQALGLTLKDLAGRLNSSIAAVARLEKSGDDTADDKKQMTVEDLLDLMRALNVEAHEIIPDLAPKPKAGGGFADDLTPYIAEDGQPAPATHDNRTRWTVGTAALDKIGIEAGDSVIVDGSQAAVDNAATGDAVVIQHTPPGGRTQTLMRQYVEPDLFVVNSRSMMAPTIDGSRDDVQIMGIIVERSRPMRRARA